MRGYGACCEELVYEGLGTVAGGGGEDGVAGAWREGVGVVAEEVSEVEGVGGWFRDGDGAWVGRVSGGGAGGGLGETNGCLGFVGSVPGSATPPSAASDVSIAESVIMVCFFVRLEWKQ